METQADAHLDAYPSRQAVQSSNFLGHGNVEEKCVYNSSSTVSDQLKTFQTFITCANGNQYYLNVPVKRVPYWCIVYYEYITLPLSTE